MNANSFSSVSMDPLMLLVCVKTSESTKFYRRFKGVWSIGFAEHQRSVSKHFAGKPEFDEAIFANSKSGNSYYTGTSNEPVVRGGPFVMNRKVGIQKAFTDYQSGKFGQV